MHKFPFYLVSFLLLNSMSSAQKAPVKFGDVSREELEMSSYAPDTTAPAVVLCNYGYFRAATTTFTQVLRIKILKKEGYDYANRKFKSDFKSSLKGMTTNLDNGKIVQEKVKNDAIYQTRVIDDYNILSVALPDVRQGSVIDFEFTVQGIPSVWRFQEEIPVIYNELIMEESSRFTIRKNFSGLEPLASVTPTRWVARNMPALKKEPLMSSIENYITKLEFDILEIMNIPLNTNWDKVDELLMDYQHFGMPSVSTAFLNDLAKGLSAQYNNRDDLLRAAYDAIREKLTWNDDVLLTTSENNISSVFKMGTGNSAELNLILYKLLGKLDFETYPLALRTRDDGTIAIEYPSLRQLNYVIVYVKQGQKEYYLDATEKYLPCNMLPIRCLNGQGRLVDKKKDLWLPLSTTRKNREIAFYNLTVEPDLTLKGNATFNMYDYSAFDFRKKYFTFNSQDEYLESSLKDKPGERIREITIDNLDSIYKPVMIRETVQIRDQVNSSDNNLYIIPGYFDELKENPFKLEARKYPVDYGILPDRTLIINLTMPEGYSLLHLPSSVTLKLPGNSAVYMYEAVVNDRNVKITGKFMIGKTVFTTPEYKDLREFYNQVIKKLSEAVILKKDV